MDEIVAALLTDQRKVFIYGIEVCLKPLPKGTYKEREKQAEKQAKQIIELINS